MSKKIIISLSVIAAVAAITVGGTIAYFNDTETSTGNIFTAGSLDLKVDHIKQTYNDVDCKTCSVTVISDGSNMVIEKNGIPISPYSAVPAWVHQAWTAQNDPILVAAGAGWIWEQNPTQQADVENDVTYTFKKSFEWWGPIVNTDLYMAVGSDNSVEVYLNDVLIGSNPGEFGYLEGSMLHIPSANITGNVNQGDNVLKFIVENFGLGLNATPYSNPAGLIYKFSIDGNCDDDYFKNNCTLWGEKDLDERDQFFMFDDVKPGDRGRNVISLHAFDNDAWACLIVHDKQDDENVLTDPEGEAGDTTDGAGFGELSPFLEVFGWDDNNKNGIYEPGSEDALFEGSLAGDPVNLKVADSTSPLPLTASVTYYVGLAWCAGTQTVDHNTGEITCDGSSMDDTAQTDSLSASLTAYIEQWRNNEEFECSNVDLEGPQ